MRDEADELFDNLRDRLASLPGESMPLLDIDLCRLWNALVPNYGSVNDCPCHIQHVFEEVLPEHDGLEAVIPHVNIKVIDSPVNRALVTPHEVKLVNDREFEHPVLPNVSLDHCCKLIDLCHVSWAEAVLVEDESVVTVHASLDTEKIFVRLVEPEVNCPVVDQVRDISKVVLIWRFVFVKAIPDSGSLIKGVFVVLGLNPSSEHAHRK